jgi:AmiR/NasT family two-component response regulator
MTTASSLAQQLAAAIESVEAYRSTAKLARELGEAMRSRAVIEQAKGILMAERHIGADEAFDQLAKLSQQANVKLRDVAGRLVAERSGPPAAG